MEACFKILKIIKRILKNKEKSNQGNQLKKFRLWRKKRTKKNKKGDDSEEEKEGEDIILLGKDTKKEEPTAVDELLEYLYTNFTELFVIDGEEKDRIMLEKETTLKVLDEIPEDLLDRILIPPPKDAKTVELQTIMTMNCTVDISKNEMADSFNHAYGDKNANKKKPKGPKNLLLKSIGRFLLNNK